jgi:uncharacterized OsmC-like protein
MSIQTAKRSDETLNGFDTCAMGQTIEALQRNRALARFEFRAANQWLGGGMNRSTIQGFFGAGAEDKSRTQPFTLIASEPPVLLGQNEAPNPGEYLLHAVAGCITTTTVLHAAARGVRIKSMSSEVSGDVDVQGLLDFDKSVPAGFRQITMRVKIEADCTDAELDDLLAFVRTHSPVADTVSRPVPVTLERIAH